MSGRTWRDHARAGLIAVHLFAISIMALPAPTGGMQRSAWRNPTVQGEFAAWTARLNAVGIAWTPGELESFAWDFASGYQTARSWVLAPFMPYYRHCGTWQSWRMFVAPHRYPSRLHIDIERNGAFEPLYEARSAEYDWRARQLDHDRMRAAIFRFGWPHHRRDYRRFAKWVRDRAAEDFPDASRVRLRFYRFRTPSPEEVRSSTQPKGSMKLELTLDLSR